MEPQPAFTLLLDRGIAAEVGLAAWCPSMDLLALATADGQLHVHRLNWQRLWWTAPEAAVTALAWHPDGKQLAVGLEDGGLLLLATEDGEVLARARPFSQPAGPTGAGAAEAGPLAVAAIAWTQQAAGLGEAGLNGAPVGLPGPTDPCWAPAGGLLEDRARRLFRPPPPQPGLPGSSATGPASGYAGLPPAGGAAEAAARGGAWPPQPSSLALLACASAGGQLVLCSGGLFRLAAVDLPTLLGAPDARVMQLAVPRSLRELTVCWEWGSGSGGQGTAHLSLLDLGALGPSAPLLHQLGVQAVELAGMLEGCARAWEAACGEWEGGVREVRESVGQLGALLHDYGSAAGQGAAAEELSRALATGLIGGALHQYLTSTLGEAGVKRLARAMDAAVHAVHAALIDAVAPAAQLAAFRLGELRGAAAPCSAPAFRQLGLKAEELAAAERAALDLLLAAEALRRRVVHVGAQYRALCAWLLTLLRRVQEDTPDSMLGFPRSQMDLLASFLRTEFVRDSVGPAMKAPAGSHSRPAPAPESGPEGPALSLAMEVLQRYCARPPPSQTVPGPRSAAVLAQPHPGRQQPAQHAEHSSCVPAIAERLGTLGALCEAAMSRVVEAMSPGVRLVNSWRLGPSPASLAVEYLEPPEAAAQRGKGGNVTAAPAAACVFASWLGQGEQAPQAMLLRLLPGSAAGADSGGQVQVEGGLLELGPGEDPVGGGFYKGGSLLLGLAPAAQQAQQQQQQQQQSAGRVVLVAPEAVRCAALSSDMLHAVDAVEALRAAGAPAEVPASSRQRAMPYHSLHAPLALSASRGVACVLAGTQRVILLDLEEDEDGGEEEEEGSMSGGGSEGQGGPAGGDAMEG